MSTTLDDVLRTTGAGTLVPADPTTTWAAVLGLVALVWDTGTVAEQPGRLLVHSVLEGGAPDCWLTWTLTPVGPHVTRVDLVHAEQAGDAPAPDLDAVLALLLSACLAPPAA